jgi:ABC-type cobalt transport system substrate-binding protein
MSTRLIVLLILAVVIFIPQLSLSSEKNGEKWKGVDDAVIEKFAQQHGREPKEPLINTDTGDLLLFVFLLAGAIGGFIAGYYWRVLLEQKRPATLTEHRQA